jgi:hypothetical protein
MSYFEHNLLGTGGSPNGVSIHQLREKAMFTSTYTGNHPGKSAPMPIEPDLTTHEQGIPDKANSSGEPTDAHATGLEFMDPRTVRILLYVGAAALIWKAANSRI